MLPGVKGMVHVSQLDIMRSDTEDFPEGTAIDVKVIDVRISTLHSHACSREFGVTRILGR